MNIRLDYSPPAAPYRSKSLRRWATIGLFFPLLVAAPLYLEWLVAWASLGHPPRPSLDDPATIAGSSWLYGFALLTILGYMPAGLAAFALNLAHLVVNRPPAGRGAARLAFVIVSWVAFLGLLRWDPGDVLTWWLD